MDGEIKVSPSRYTKKKKRNKFKFSLEKDLYIVTFAADNMCPNI